MILEVYGEKGTPEVTRLRLNKMANGRIDIEIVDKNGNELDTIGSFRPDGVLELWDAWDMVLNDYGFKLDDGYIAIEHG